MQDHQLTIVIASFWRDPQSGRCSCGWHTQAQTADRVRERFERHLREVAEGDARDTAPSS